jgi:sulfatase modifying factor 1
MTRALKSLFLLSALAFCAPVASAVTIDWLPVGNPGNAADTRVRSDGTAGYGSVSYSYQIAKYDVTNSQYIEFLNAKDPSGANSLQLYDANMTASIWGGINYDSAAASGSKYSAIAGRGNYPANFVSWYDALRFTNWFNNGQGSGDTENGSYLLEGGTPIPSNADTIARSASARFVLPSENEWYKAAYFNPANGSYFLYGTSSNVAPTESLPTIAANAANYDQFVNHPTDVGAYSGTTSPYGALDMAGNVLQWNDTRVPITIFNFPVSSGGSFQTIPFVLSAASRHGDNPQFGGGSLGFRLATVPEPSTLALAVLALVGLTAYRWRRRR